VKLDKSNDTINKKVRTHQLEQWSYILVAGEEEAKAGTVDVRSRENNRLGKMRIDKVHEYFQSL
jgi:threonyl-tRNA synthetase